MAYEMGRTEAKGVLGNEIAEMLGDAELVESAVDDIVSMSMDIDSVSTANHLGSKEDVDTAWDGFMLTLSRFNKMLTVKGASVIQITGVLDRLAVAVG